MSDVPEVDRAVPGTSEPQRIGVRPTWLIVLAVVVAVLLCGCASVVFLVLTGIIAEPETVLEQIVRALLGS